MSRIGRSPVKIPSGVQVTIDGATVVVKGPKGELTRAFRPEITVHQEAGQITVQRPSDAPSVRALHGLTRALLNNMVLGVTAGFGRNLEIQGTGYRAAMEGNTLVLQLRFSLPIRFEVPKGITIKVENPTGRKT